MLKLLNEDNFNEYFAGKEAFIASRHELYRQEVVRIHRLTAAGQPQDVDELLAYLRPWNIVTEDNWIGREWLRLVAMQALLFLAIRSQDVKRYLESVKISSDAKWREFDPEVNRTWKEMTDSSCLPDPFSDFQRCLSEVLSCVGQ